MLYLIGLGLHDEKDLSLKAVEALKACDKVYVELYTSRWHGSMEELEKLIGKPVKQLGRENVENLQLAKEAKEAKVALLIPGDPLVATTHFDLIIEARKAGIETQVIHSSTIFAAIAEIGLQSYKFGRPTSLTFPEPNFDPDSPYEVIAENKKLDMHSVIYLDVRPPKYMTIKEALEILLKKEDKLKENVISNDTKVIAAAEIGGDMIVLHDTVSNLIAKDPKKVPAILIIPAKLHFKEEEALGLWK